MASKGEKWLEGGEDDVGSLESPVTTDPFEATDEYISNEEEIWVIEVKFKATGACYVS